MAFVYCGTLGFGSSWFIWVVYRQSRSSPELTTFFLSALWIFSLQFNGWRDFLFFLCSDGRWEFMNLGLRPSSKLTCSKLILVGGVSVGVEHLLSFSVNGRFQYFHSKSMVDGSSWLRGFGRLVNLPISDSFSLEWSALELTVSLPLLWSDGSNISIHINGWW